MNTPTIPDWKLERYLLGELPHQELEDIRRRAESDDLLMKRLAALRQSDSALRETYPSDSVLPGIRARMAERVEPARPRRQWLLVALPIAAALVLFINPAPNQIVVDGNRIKGGDPALYLYRKTADGVEELQNGDIASEHDLIQIKYQPGDKRYGVILSVDGRNTISVHLPEKGRQAAELELGRADTLGFSYELDDAPTRERFYFISSVSAFAVQEAIDAVKTHVPDQGPQLDLAEGYSQRIFTLMKDTNDAN
jgi:hypothetical protein